MRYYDIAPMCKPRGGLRACPHDGLSCTGGKKCSINSDNFGIKDKAWNATAFGKDFVCAKREWAKRRSTK